MELEQWAAWGLRHLLLVPSRSVLTNYSVFLLGESKPDKEHPWRIVITEFLVFALILFNAAACEDVFKSKTAHLPIVAKGLGVVVPTPKCLACWIIDSGFFAIIQEPMFDLSLVNATSWHGQELY